jgi:outer membrane phospholipase A
MQHLSVGVEELDKTSGSWNRFQTLRVAQAMSLEVSMGTGEWKAFRLATA